MKTQSLTTALAFLAAAFMSGCQESGPVAPEGLGPQFHVDHATCQGHDKKTNPDCNGDGVGETVGEYSIVFTNTGISPEITGSGSASVKITATYFQDADMGPLTISPLVSVDFASSCFPAGGVIAKGNFQIIVEEQKKPPEKATVLYLFRALGTDGKSRVRYEFSTSGVIGTVGNWLPKGLAADGDPSSTNTLTGTTWTLGWNAGPNKDKACTGGGAFSYEATMTRTS